MMVIIIIIESTCTYNSVNVTFNSTRMLFFWVFFLSMFKCKTNGIYLIYFHLISDIVEWYWCRWGKTEWICLVYWLLVTFNYGHFNTTLPIYSEKYISYTLITLNIWTLAVFISFWPFFSLEYLTWCHWCLQNALPALFKQSRTSTCTLHSPL